MFGPDILANRDADFFRAEEQRRGGAAGLEVAVLVEDIVGGQQRLEGFRDRRAGLEQGLCEWSHGLVGRFRSR